MPDDHPQTQDGFVMPTVAQTLKKLCIDNHFTDPNLVLDVYLIVANQGKASYMPDEDLMKDIERTDPAYWDLRTDLSKRKEFLDRLAASKYMQALVQLQDPMKAVLTFVDHMKKAREAQIRSRKGTGPIDHMGGAFDGNYSGEDDLDELGKINDAYDPAADFDRLLGGQTTHINVVQDEGVSAFLEGAQEEEIKRAMSSSGCGGKSAWASFTSTPGQNLAQAVVRYGVDLPKNFPILFDWYTKLLDDLMMGKLKEVDVDRDAKHKRDDAMEDFDKLATVDPSEVAHETFDKRVADKSLVVKHDRDEERGMSHVFVLLDVSGSMMGCDLGGRVCRAFAANVVTLALLNFAFKEKYKVWVLPFEATVSNVMSAEGKQQALDLMRWLGTVNYDGGGTDIEGAVLRAYSLTTADPNYNKADIVVITDGCSPISRRIIDQKPERTKLRSIVISDGAEHHGQHFKNLIGACDSWSFLTWDSMKNEFSVGNTLKGISSTNSTTGQV